MSNAMPIAPENVQKYIKIGRNIAYYRKQRGYTQAELAKMIGISRSHLSAIEAPNVLRPFSIELLLNFADALRVPPAKLLAF
ncbi:MAG: helix-turn-helix transcriptional regulator [Oscillospiraceae bacterium]|jgi:transcriptional regulator with XRE-family HTH domain|nr:helix-turn-helix transcriptional regulator [Oscillospiraceae bacterium]